MWNALRKNIALISRNRVLYDDVPYSLIGAYISLSDADFTSSSPNKRTYVSLG